MSILTLQQLQTKKHFDKVVIEAGHDGLHKQIKWVHILETIHVQELVHGNELILTTGTQLKNEPDFLHFVQQLVAKDVAGLCIEFGQHVQAVPQIVCDYANAHSFPILSFREIVPFIEITKDVHSTLVNQQYQMVKRLEDYAVEINKLTLNARHYEQILMRMYKYLNMHVVFFINGQTPIILPNTHRERYEQLRAYYLQHGHCPYFASYDVIILEEKYGELCIFNIDQPLNEFDLLILDRTVIALSQFLLRTLYIEETQNLESQLFLEKWVTDETSKGDVEQFIEQQNNYKLASCRWFVLTEQLKRTKHDYDLTYYKMYIRSLFENFGLQLFLIESKGKFTYIVADVDGHKLKERIASCIDKMVAFKSSSVYDRFETTIAVGQLVDHFSAVPQSYTTALDTLEIRLQSAQTSYFYDDLYLQQMILQIRRNKAMMDISKRYLQPLINYDKKNNSQLVITLKTYLQFNGQKNETAEALFIVRQTLYHRLSKIEQLLGDDYMTYPKRLILELMLVATDASPFSH